MKRLNLDWLEILIKAVLNSKVSAQIDSFLTQIENLFSLLVRWTAPARQSIAKSFREHPYRNFYLAIGTLALIIGVIVALNYQSPTKQYPLAGELRGFMSLRSYTDLQSTQPYCVSFGDTAPFSMSNGTTIYTATLTTPSIGFGNYTGSYYTIAPKCVSGFTRWQNVNVFSGNIEMIAKGPGHIKGTEYPILGEPAIEQLLIVGFSLFVAAGISLVYTFIFAMNRDERERAQFEALALQE